MQAAQMKLQRRIGKKSSKASRSRSAGPKKSKTFQAAVAKAVVQQKAKDSGFVDHDGSSTAGLTAAVEYANEFNLAGSVTFVGGCKQGASENEHPNKKFLLKSLQVRGEIYGQTGAVINNCALLLVLDTEPTGSAVTIANIFKAVPSGTYAGLPSSLRMLEPASSSRFRILARRNYTIQGAAGDPYGNVMVDEFFDLKKIEVTTKGATSGFGDVQKNALYLVQLGTQPTGSGAASARLVGRMRFIDL